MSEAIKSLSSEVVTLVETTDIKFTLQVQDETKEKLQRSVLALSSFNDQAAKEFAEMASELEQYTRLQRIMKRDLDDIFRRLRSLKNQLSKKFPLQYNAAIASLGTIPSEEGEVNGLKPQEIPGEQPNTL